jgi:predicted metal-dependent hydrolase
MANIADIPAYTVRVSRRARHVRLVLSLTDGLQVVIPEGFDVSRVSELVRDRLTWFERARERLRSRQMQPGHPRAVVALPHEIFLPAVGETWRVVYRPDVTMLGVRLRDTDTTLIVTGRVQDFELCRTVLKRWLARRARVFLTEQLTEIGSITDLSFSRLSVRGQRSRWGSCSPRGNLSLNYKLLFLPPPLMRYVLVHELCHTRQPNHGAGFWALVARYEPAYRRLRSELRRAGSNVPEWAR